MFGRGCKQGKLIGGPRRWNSLLAGIDATNLGALSVKYWQPLWTTQRGGGHNPLKEQGRAKGAKGFVFFLPLLHRAL